MWLRQSTVSVINFGPALDFADGTSLEVGLVASLDHAATGIMLSKNGGTLTIREQGTNFVATAYDAHGNYKVSLSAVDTNTLGRLRVIHSEPVTYLAVWRDFMVVPAQVWDSLFGTDKLDVSLVQINGAAQTATLDTLDVLIDAIKLKTDTLGGAGSISYPFIVTQTGGAAVDGAQVWVSTDSGGTNIIANGITDVNGLYTFHLDAGTYTFWAQHSGLNPASVQETVA